MRILNTLFNDQKLWFKIILLVLLTLVGMEREEKSPDLQAALLAIVSNTKSILVSIR